MSQTKNKGGRPRMYLLREMSVGDSLVVPKHKAASIRTQITKAQKNGKKFRTRAMPDGMYMVWCAADPEHTGSTKGAHLIWDGQNLDFFNRLKGGDVFWFDGQRINDDIVKDACFSAGLHVKVNPEPSGKCFVCILAKGKPPETVRGPSTYGRLYKSINGNIKYPFKNMRIGESFDFDVSECSIASVKNVVAYYKRISMGLPFEVKFTKISGWLHRCTRTA